MMDNVHIIYSPVYSIKDVDPDRSMLILGTSTEGPVNKPTYIESYDKAKIVFGSGTLSQAWYTAKQAGGQDIYLVRVNGTCGRTDIINDDIRIYFSSKNAGAKYNQVLKVTTMGDTKATFLNLHNFDGSIRQYDLAKYPSMGQLYVAINRDSELGISDFTINQEELSIPVASNELPFPMTMVIEDGLDTDGTLKQNLATTYEEILDFPAKVIVLADAYYGGEVDYLASDECLGFSEFCYNRNCMGVTTTGVIAALPKGTTPLATYVNNLLEKADLSDEGIFVACIAGEVAVHDGDTLFTTSLASALGGLLNSLPSHLSIQNKGISRGTLSYNLDYPSLSLAGINYATTSIRRGIVSGSSVTMGTGGYASLSRTRIAQYISSSVTTQLEPYIGKGNSSFSDNVVNMKINDLMQGMVNNSYIRSFSYKIASLQSDTRLVNIDFLPLGEIQSVSISVQL